jgi:hypothetical protein
MRSGEQGRTRVPGTLPVTWATELFVAPVRKLFEYLCLSALSVLGLMYFAPTALAQCANNVVPSCNIYATCFAKYCPCNGDDEYFLSYGKRYCDQFLGLPDFSSEGKKWRDKTLICLQEAIVPKLDISNKPVCDCKIMKQHAFVSHIRCYLADPSICSLPATDKLKILNAVGLGTLINDELSRKQFREVLSSCVNSTFGKALEALRTTLANLSQ